MQKRDAASAHTADMEVAADASVCQVGVARWTRRGMRWAQLVRSGAFLSCLFFSFFFLVGDAQNTRTCARAQHAKLHGCASAPSTCTHASHHWLETLLKFFRMAAPRARLRAQCRRWRWARAERRRCRPPGEDMTALHGRRTQLQPRLLLSHGIIAVICCRERTASCGGMMKETDRGKKRRVVVAGSGFRQTHNDGTMIIYM